MSGMAEVLAAHNLISHERSGSYACTDPDCGWEFRYRARMDDFRRGVDVVAREFAAHQASMLSAAGFGPVKEAKAEAWQEGFKQGGPMHDVNYDDPDAHTRNPYRAAAVRSEG